MAGRFIKLYDKMLQWEWFHHADTLQLFLYLLLKANYKDGTFQGIEVKRGQLITSLSKLGQATGQSTRMVRDNLNHLELTGEVTSKATNRYRIITVVKYDEYQTVDKQNDKQMTSQLTSHLTSKTTSQPTPSIEYIELQNNRKIESPTESRGTAQRFIPPTPEQVSLFCQGNGYQIDPERFCDYYASRGWKVGSSPMKDWKAAVKNWVRRDQAQASAKPAVQAPVRQSSAHNFEERSFDPKAYEEEKMSNLAAEMARFKRTGEIEI